MNGEDKVKIVKGQIIEVKTEQLPETGNDGKLLYKYSDLVGSIIMTDLCNYL